MKNIWHGLLLIISILTVNCSKDDKAANAVAGPENKSTTTTTTDNKSIGVNLPNVPTNAGQLILSLVDVAPESVAGYVVGKQDALKIQRTEDGKYFIDNIPAGKQDIIISAKKTSTNLFGLVSENSEVGVRLSGVEILNGVRTTKSDVKLAQLRKLSGKVHLRGQGKYGGVQVYVPGTDLIAISDDEGNFSISRLPVGIHNLVTEKSGYHRGRLESITVLDTEDKVVNQAIEMVLSTGAEGFISLNNGESSSTSRVVDVTVGASDEAVLMKISENVTFEGASWVPLASSSSYTFATPGPKKVYVMFATANGLTSSPFSTEINVAIFPAVLETNTFKIGEGSARIFGNGTGLTFELPANATEYIISEDSSFSGAAWQPSGTQKNYTFNSEGNKTLYVKFRDKDRFESAVVTKAIRVKAFEDNEGSVSINNGASASTSKQVTLNLTLPSNAVQMKVSQNSDFSGANFENVTAQKSITLGGTGGQSVYVKFKSQDGYESTTRAANIEVIVRYVGISRGDSGGCAVTDDGDVKCWSYRDNARDSSGCSAGAFQGLGYCASTSSPASGIFQDRCPVNLRTHLLT